MNNKYHITSDGSIFEMQPDGSLKKLGSVADGQLNPYSDTNKTSNKSHYVCSEKAVNWIYNSVEGRS